MELSFFDCNCMLGKRADRKEGEPWSVDQLLASMDSCGIADAIVLHASSRDYDPVTGNQEISRIVSSNSRLHGCWAILPPASNELPPPAAFVSEMVANKIVAAIAYPHTHNYSLADWSLGPLLSALENQRIPLFLPFGQFTWDEVERLCAQHLYLPVVTTGVNYRQLRFLLPLWERYRNLFVDLSWLSLHGGLDYLAQRGLVQQVLFGTNYPVYEPGAAVTMVTYANLKDEQRDMVAGATLRRILGAIRSKRP